MSDYETTDRRRNIIVGIFVVGSLSALVWLIFKFQDLPRAISKIGSYQVFVQFPTAMGVQRDTDVYLSGYRIGNVTEVMAPKIRREILPNGKLGKEYHQTVIVLSIDKQYANIPSNVEVKLMTRGLGSSYIELKVNPDALPAPPIDPTASNATVSGISPTSLSVVIKATGSPSPGASSTPPARTSIVCDV